MPRLSFLLLGRAESGEFRDARPCLEAWGTVRGFADPAEAEAALAAGAFVPAALGVAQRFPGEFSHAAVDRLRRAAPLARVIGLMGGWCEGEMRSGSPWPGTVRVYWHQWPARCRRELSRLAEGRCDSWALPPTAAEEERVLADAEEPQPRRGGTIAVAARLPASTAWLAEACRSRGHAVVRLRPGRETFNESVSSNLAAAVFDAPDLHDATFDELRQLIAALPGAPVIALLSFPRAADRDRALAAGAAVVLSKPVSLGEFFDELDRLGGGTFPGVFDPARA